MTCLRCQVTFTDVNTIPRDACVNVWHFESSSVDRLVDAAACVADLNDFYDSIDGLMSARLSGDGFIKVYDLVDVPPRAPILEYTFSITPGVAQPLPHEVAICLSYHGALISGFPRGRTRGRIYLGPWTIATLDSGVGDAIVDSGTAGAIAGAAQTLMEAGSPANHRWVVFSPTAAGNPPWSAGDLTLGMLPVIGGWVDDAFDTVRSRGNDPSTRQVFPD